MLYTLILDSNKYLSPLLDRAQIHRILGETTEENVKYRIDFKALPVSYKGVFNEPLNVSFPKALKSQKNCEIPDIAAFQGRLFLGLKAYEVLKPLLDNDGEFLPANYELGKGYIYIPLKVAEDVDGLDTELSRKDEWGQVANLAFHEDRVKAWNVFRTEFNGYHTLQCQQAVKDAIEKAGFTGLYITPNLGNIFPEEPGAVSKIN